MGQCCAFTIATASPWQMNIISCPHYPSPTIDVLVDGPSLVSYTLQEGNGEEDDQQKSAHPEHNLRREERKYISLEKSNK